MLQARRMERTENFENAKLENGATTQFWSWLSYLFYTPTLYSLLSDKEENKNTHATKSQELARSADAIALYVNRFAAGNRDF